MHITGNMLNGRGDEVPGCERGVHNNAEAFYLEVSLVWGFEGASIVEVMVKWCSKMGVRDGSDEGSVFGRRWKKAEAVTVDRDINREDRGNFYSRWRRRGNYGRGERQGGQYGEFWTARRWSVFRKPELGMFCGEEKAECPPRGGDVGWESIRRRGVRCQGISGCQRGGTHDVR